MTSTPRQIKRRLLREFKRELKREALHLLSRREYTDIKLIDSDAKVELLDKVLETLVPRRSLDDGLTVKQLSEQVGEPDIFKVMEILQFIKKMELMENANIMQHIENEKIQTIAILPVYSEKAEGGGGRGDNVYFNCAGNQQYLEKYMAYLGFTIPNEDLSYYKTKKGGLLNIAKKTESEKELEAILLNENPKRNVEEWKEALQACTKKMKEECLKEDEAYQEQQKQQNEKYRTATEEELIDNFEGTYEDPEELEALMAGIINIISQEENPDRINNVMALISEDSVSEQTKNKTEIELARILLPESVRETSPGALEPYVKKIRDAISILRTTNWNPKRRG
jgi:hypothetical protein